MYIKVISIYILEMQMVDYRKEFEAFTGVHANDKSVRVFTAEQQIERHAKALAFWDISRAKAGKDSRKVMYTSQARSQTIDMIERFPDAMQEKIYERRNEIIRGVKSL